MSRATSSEPPSAETAPTTTSVKLSRSNASYSASFAFSFFARSRRSSSSRMNRSYALITSSVGPSIAIRPRSSQIVRSQNRATWSSACETSSTPAPLSISWLIRAVERVKK